MSKKSFKVLVPSVLLGGLVCFGAMTNSIAGVNINIGTPDLNISIGTPPPFVIKSPPPMAVIPGSYVYIAPNPFSAVIRSWRAKFVGSMSERGRISACVL